MTNIERSARLDDCASHLIKAAAAMISVWQDRDTELADKIDELLASGDYYDATGAQDRLRWAVDMAMRAVHAAQDVADYFDRSYT